MMVAKKLPPGPEGKHVTGNLKEFVADPLTFLTHCASYGDVARFRLLNLPFYLVNNPDYIEDLLITNSRNLIKGKPLRELGSVIGNGLALSSGEFWLRQRRLMQPNFHRQRIAGYGKSMVDYTERMLDGWQDSETREIDKDMAGLSLQIVSKCLFNTDIDTEAKEVGTALTVFMDRFARRFGQLHLPNSIPTPSNIRFRNSLHKLNTIVYRIIDEHRNDNRNSADLLSMLLHAQDEDGSRMTNQQLRDEVITMFIAGHETSAVALAWAWYLLAQHPEVEAKLQDEVADVLEGRRPSVEDIPRLSYADMVIKEVMRLYPPAWLITREVIQDCKIGDYDAPAGTQIIISQWVTQRDARYFDQPEQFKPERWLNADVQKGSKHTYLPFGAGARGCIGSSFALMETVLILTTVAQQYRMSLLPAHPIVPLASATLRPKYGLAVKLEKKSIAYDTITTYTN